MILRDALLIAFRGLRSHKLRSGLTMLGLIIGVAAVILLTSFGQGVAGSATAAVEPIANSITVVPRLSPIPGGPSAEPLTDDDADAIAELSNVAQVVPVVTGATTGAGGQVTRALTASTPGAQYLSATVTGTTANYAEARRQRLIAGAFFSDAQARSGANVAVVGPLIASALYGPDPHAAIGRPLRISHANFRVIGVLQSYGAAADGVIVMPQAAARSGVFGYGYGGDELSSLIVKATSTADVNAAEGQITDLLRERHHIANSAYDDFQVQDLGARLTAFNQLIALITNFVPAIAAISLFVGGIGVLNIMLVSVTDRTREIGTRKAVGASDSAILGQFAMEAVALAGVGGLVGVVLGVGLILIARLTIPLLGTTGFLSSFSPVLTGSPIAIAFLISLAIGLIAGGYPAWRAAQLNPIEALRYE